MRLVTTFKLIYTALVFAGLYTLAVKPFTAYGLRKVGEYIDGKEPPCGAWEES